MSVTVLAGPDGGLCLRIQNDVTGEVAAEVLTREAAEALVEQASATLRCAPLDPHAKAMASFEVWKARRAGHICQIAKPLHLMTRADEAHEAFGRR